MANANKPRTAKQLANDQRLREEAAARKASQNQNQGAVPPTNSGGTENGFAFQEPTPAAAQNLITLTPDQFEALIGRLNAGNITDKAPAPSLSPQSVGAGLQTNALGQVVGTFKKYEINPDYYPNPVERLIAEPRLSRFSMDENYFIAWDITSKPYQTKDNINIQEPTFHLTLYANEFDDQGEPTDRAIVIQTLHMNEDEEIALLFAAEQGIETEQGSEGFRKLMDDARYERAKRWLIDIFFPPRNFDLTVQDREEAIGGSVVKVVTKSNVKGFGNKAPKISEEELA